MKEVWIKKTIWRRHLIDDESAGEVQGILDYTEPALASEMVRDCYDTLVSAEYDNESVLIPLEYEIKTP